MCSFSAFGKIMPLFVDRNCLFSHEASRHSNDPRTVKGFTTKIALVDGDVHLTWTYTDVDDYWFILC